MSTNKIDVSTVCEMFEKIIEKLGQLMINKPTEPTDIDLSAVNAVTEQLETIIEEIRKPAKIEHRHTIAVGSIKIFLSLAVMAIMILGLSYFISSQRHTINQYKNNDLKYRYIKMQGQTDEENIYHLERQFRNNDSIRTIRRQVEKYEDLIREQVERMERIERNSEEVNKINQQKENVKNAR